MLCVCTYGLHRPQNGCSGAIQEVAFFWLFWDPPRLPMAEEPPETNGGLKLSQIWLNMGPDNAC